MTGMNGGRVIAHVKISGMYCFANLNGDPSAISIQASRCPGTRGHIALYSDGEAKDLVTILAIRSQKEAGYHRS
jgi:hypothetical protein